MAGGELKVTFARRGYSATGGAEAYLRRLARGVVDAGYAVQLLTTDDWPREQWTFGDLVHMRCKTPIGFADEVEKYRSGGHCDVLFSLERVWRCDIYRAGDGVHQAWLNRRGEFGSPWQRFRQKFNPKHRDLLRLEQCLLGDRCAERVIVNSKMVKDEIFDLYSYRPDMIDVIPNGVPLERFRFDTTLREKSRSELGLKSEEVAVLFVGTGWERKGLGYAIEAIENSPTENMQLLVVGRGDAKPFRSTRARFIGEVDDPLPIYAASDIFILPTIYDPFSNACLEALACGLPVITTRANGFSEIMEDRIHGSIVDSGQNVSDLVKALEDWSNPTRRAAARPSILKRAGQFDISRNVEQTIRTVAQLASSAASTSGKIRNT